MRGARLPAPSQEGGCYLEASNSMTLDKQARERPAPKQPPFTYRQTGNLTEDQFDWEALLHGRHFGFIRRYDRGFVFTTGHEDGLIRPVVFARVEEVKQILERTWGW